MILICYDGSADADAAVDAVAAVMPRQPATLLTVWEPFVDVVTRYGPGLELWPAEIDAATSSSSPLTGIEVPCSAAVTGAHVPGCFRTCGNSRQTTRPSHR